MRRVRQFYGRCVVERQEEARVDDTWPDGWFRILKKLHEFEGAGDFAAARALHERYYDLFHDLFIDTNPIMVKEALVMTGRIGPGFRLPLCETTPEKREKLRSTLVALGLGA